MLCYFGFRPDQAESLLRRGVRRQKSIYEVDSVSLLVAFATAFIPFGLSGDANMVARAYGRRVLRIALRPPEFQQAK